MRGREGKGPQSTDLLVCFPSRAHLSLMPKAIRSPARPSDSSAFHRRCSSRHRLRHPGNRGGGHGSPLMWAKVKHNNNNNNYNNSDISEPSSPKVTCAGQIKVRPKPSSCKNWQSVMEEIERMHHKKKRPAWMEALGFKKEVMQFLTCLRNISFDFRCFGSVPAVEISSDDDEDEEDDDDDEDEEDRNHLRKSSGGGDQGSSGAVFSTWFTILQEENLSKEMNNMISPRSDEPHQVTVEAEPVPPPNALLLMRCRSAPAKSWLEEREEEERERRESEECDEEVKKKEEEVNYCEFAVEIGNENWIQERISRSRSWMR